MPGTGQSYIVAGAGITGLTLALALAKFGASVTVLERSSALSEFGAGLQVSPNARRVLDRLGLDEALRANSLEPAGIDIYPYGRATPLVTLELGAVMRQRFGAPYVVMHRADLAEVLHKATRRFANIDIRFGAGDWAVRQDESGVAVTLAGQTLRARAFIGADGVRSRTRTEMLTGPQAQYRGRVAWRAMAPFSAAASQIALDRVSVLFGPGYHLVCYPMPHREQVNFALFAQAPQTLPDDSHAPGLPPVHQRSPRIEALLAAIGRTWTPWPLYGVETPLWHKGRIGIIGDAAHGMVPFQAQGAAMGIEDAAVLAPLLVHEANATTAFEKYAAIRQPRVQRVADISTMNGRIFHMGWPLSLGRNLVIGLQGPRGHIGRLAWLYGHDAQPPGLPTLPGHEN
ncbi:FAD-dependent monooxygenase [Devosia sp.]|uniref:FAD-dependent monooxygenase n=1 Tax=Devosia sp. TaxID=1871048 RepID=UPI002B003C69|nr:FAD-dependent monooxygenase [Devosia sp.]